MAELLLVALYGTDYCYTPTLHDVFSLRCTIIGIPPRDAPCKFRTYSAESVYVVYHSLNSTSGDELSGLKDLFPGKAV